MSQNDGGTATKYYYAGTQRVAMRVNGTLYFLLSDQLGTTSVTANASGGLVSELRFTAWGTVRYASGTTPTKYTHTGQYSNVSDFGLMYYGARWYDPALGRFAQADTDALSARAYHCVLKLACTITDLAGNENTPLSRSAISPRILVS